MFSWAAWGQKCPCGNIAPLASSGCLSRGLRSKAAPGAATVSRRPPPSMGALHALTFTTCTQMLNAKLLALNNRRLVGKRGVIRLRQLHFPGQERLSGHRLYEQGCARRCCCTSQTSFQDGSRPGPHFHHLHRNALCPSASSFPFIQNSIMQRR